MGVDLGKDPKGHFPNHLYPQKPPSLGFGTYMKAVVASANHLSDSAQKILMFRWIVFTFVSLLSGDWLLTSAFK